MDTMPHMMLPLHTAVAIWQIPSCRNPGWHPVSDTIITKNGQCHAGSSVSFHSCSCHLGTVLLSGSINRCQVRQQGNIAGWQGSIQMLLWLAKDLHHWMIRLILDLHQGMYNKGYYCIFELLPMGRGGYLGAPWSKNRSHKEEKASGYHLFLEKYPPNVYRHMAW